jgi:hypothetical protein
MTQFHPVYREFPRSVRTTGAFHTAANPVRTVSGLFRTPELAERAVRSIERFGYNRHAFNVMMNRRIRNFFFKPLNKESATDHRTWEGARFGALVGAAFSAFITIGANAVLHFFGLTLEETVLFVLTGILAGGLTGLLIGAVVGSGVSGEDDRDSLEPDEDEFLISVVPATSDDGIRIAEAWEAIGGENIHH